MIDDTHTAHAARALAAALEPCIGQVYFAPECHAAYEALGFGASPATIGGVALPESTAYFTSRGSLMGQVAPHVVAAAFAVFNPAIVVPGVEAGWTLTDAPTIFAARRRGAVAQLRRILGDSPAGIDAAATLMERAVEPLRVEGRPLFAGLRSQWDSPADPVTRFFHLGDELREYRGDSHTIAWTSAGLDPIEIGLLTELFMRLPPRTYIRSRGWSDGELDAASARLASRGWLGADGFTDTGRAAREEIEATTDRQMQPALDALGDDLDMLVGLLVGWADEIREAGGYVRTASQIRPRRAP